MTTIVNIKQKYIKDEYENLKEWCKDKNNIYIGRKGVLIINGEDRENVILKYKIYLLKKLKDDKNFTKEFYKLKNKNLGCWCKPDSCGKFKILF